jgi:hypothetical protein
LATDTKLWSRNLKERDCLVDLGVDGKMYWNESYRKVWIGFMWLRIEFSDRFL